MRRSIALTLLALVACTFTALAQTVNLRPGNYEKLVEIEMPGMKMPAVKDTSCITTEELKDLSKALLDPEFAKECKVTDYKIAANKLTFNTNCKSGDTSLVGTVEMTFAAESFTGLMTAKDKDGNVMNIKTTAKRIGECTK